MFSENHLNPFQKRVISLFLKHPCFSQRDYANLPEKIKKKKYKLVIRNEYADRKQGISISKYL